MPKISVSDVVAGVYVVEPEIHGDQRGLFIETYRRSWFPNGREMVQGNRANRARQDRGVEFAHSRPLLAPGQDTRRQHQIEPVGDKSEERHRQHDGESDLERRLCDVARADVVQQEGGQCEEHEQPDDAS